MPWQIIVLRDYDEDLAQLHRTTGVDVTRFHAHVVAEFTDVFKAARVEKMLEAGAATAAIARLASSAYPPSIRLQVLQEFRVTAWCYPAVELAVVTHAFHKSQDPDYRRAVQVHDNRLSSYVAGLHGFFQRKRRA